MATTSQHAGAIAETISMPAMLHRAIKIAGISEADFLAELRQGMGKRGRFSRAACETTITKPAAALLPPLTATLNGGEIDAELRLSSTAIAVCRSQSVTIHLSDMHLPETVKMASLGMEVRKLIKHPLLNATTAPIRHVELASSGSPLRISYEDQHVLVRAARPRS